MIKKYKRISKRIIASILSAVMITGTLAGVGISNTETVKAKDYGISNPRINADGSVTWDKIKFGSYKQSVEFEYEPIKWRILSVDENNNALLLADKGIDCKPYNEEMEYVTWETCTLRAWLNDDFYNEAFSEAEKAEINEVKVKNEDNPLSGTEGGNDTIDRLYMLSIEEASNSAYGFTTESATIECKVTDFAHQNGAARSSSSVHAGNSCWWLRSPGHFPRDAAEVADDGWGINENGEQVQVRQAVRPTLQINLSSSLVKDAGEVVSDGTVTDESNGYNNPIVTGDKTVWDCVYFGRYKQNISVLEKEFIEWRVLSVDEDMALLLADKGLDCKPYNKDEEVATWETCTLRTWLNEEFFNEAFNESEQTAIKQVTVKNDDNSEYGTYGGDDTTDKVYLLSIEEASSSAYGFNSEFNAGNTENATRYCTITEYARMNGASRDSISGNGEWWLRSTGKIPLYAAYVQYEGIGNDSGDYVNRGHLAVRPALRIDLSSSVWQVSGTVSTGPGAVDPNQPIRTPKPIATPESTDTPHATVTPKVSKSPVVTATPTQTPAITSAPNVTISPNNSNTQSGDKDAKLKSIKLSSVICKRNTTKITGKVSISGATVKIKVGSKAYKKAAVKGKKFTLKVPKLRKKTKVVIKVTKSGYKSLSKTYKVK